MKRRARHMLLTKCVIEVLGRNARLPRSRSLALAADVHPSTARRWLADLRAILPMKASDLRRIGR